ncbi:cation channel sperm-associated protein 4-like [Hypanus sabinus]|uniref:cation channel sperm-associated protein 4-like n=1 Tax=Hypanus sabinus TaxID=79690 RepID=UPI0028C42F31|nr:cation channel sperm-associated protein 4-like [Hypanus sabinus]
MAFDEEACQMQGIILKYSTIFVTFEQVLVTIFLWEMLLKWYYGFWVFWKDAWNIADFIITFTLFVGSTLSNNNELFYVLRVLRALRIVRSLAAIQGLAIILQVIFRSISDMANVMFLLILIILVFAVFGVIIFGTYVPDEFGSLERAMYSLFVCITLDGWVEIYSKFKETNGVMMYWGGVYLFLFLIGGSFILANIMVAAVTSNLEQAMSKEEEKRQTLTGGSPLKTKLKDDTMTSPEMDLVHMKDCIKQIILAQKQQPLRYSSLENLSISTYEEFCLVLEAIQKNIEEYKQIRAELNSIVKEMRDMFSNREPQKHFLHNEKKIMEFVQTLLTSDIPTLKKKEMLSNILVLEKTFKKNQSPSQSNLYQRTQELSSSRLMKHVPDN